MRRRGSAEEDKNPNRDTASGKQVREAGSARNVFSLQRGARTHAAVKSATEGNNPILPADLGLN